MKKNIVENAKKHILKLTILIDLVGHIMASLLKTLIGVVVKLEEMLQDALFLCMLLKKN